MAEGSSSNKYLEIYNPTDAAISLSGYYFGSVANAPTTAGQYEYQNPFASGATIAPGDVYVVCHPSANPTSITAECDETTWQYLSNGDDGWCLLKGDATTYTFIDCVGDFEGDPGNGWDVCGVSEATKDATLVRKASADFTAATQAAVGAAKPSEAIWEYSSVTDCQWDLYPIDTHEYVGSHTVALPDLFISEYSEGGSNNKYIEVYNPTAQAVLLDGYYFGTTSNAPSNPGQWEYQNTFAAGAMIAPGDVYVYCNPGANTAIAAECDETGYAYHNGDDAICLLKGDATSYEFMDCVGDYQADPGSGWDVCGVTGATADKTLVRKADADTAAAAQAAVGATSPSQALWTFTSVTNCQWDIYDIDTHDYVGSHTVSGGGAGPAPSPAPSVGPTVMAAPTISVGQDLFISEYSEGGSNNKYLEVSQIYLDRTVELFEHNEHWKIMSL